jgi:alpha-glucosidase (family GH31 glycosyl hydrolase)
LECERRVFHFPDPARSVMMAALRRRYELVPYVYGEMRTCAETGLSLIRPMY